MATDNERDANSNQKPLFRDINPDEDEPEVTEIESLCMNCEDSGITRLMLTKIPFFKEVILCSFRCDKCGFSNSEIQSAGRVQELGVRYSVKVQNIEDLNRQVVKSETAVFRIPKLEFEQPSNGKGQITTIESLLDAVINGLQELQPQRRAVDQETAAKIDDFIGKLALLKTGNEEFTLVLDDPSGNSFLENPFAPKKDPNMTREQYRRSAQQERQLGLVAADSTESPNEPEPEEPEEEGADMKKEVLAFQVNCPECSTPCETNMKVVDIPFFKEVVIMATTCEACGHRDNEVKGGSGIEDKGTRIKLKITDSTDLSRDVLKSDSCALYIPEIELELMAGTLGGRFTTVEGLLSQIKDQLSGDNPFVQGDSAQDDSRGKLSAFLEKLDKVISGEMLNVHFVLDDPAGNSFLQNLYAPDDDPEMEITHYIRNHEQNDELGINEMKTENYSHDS